MAHPMNHLRDHKVQRARVSDITKACGGMASGGHADEAQDKAMVHKMVKKAALRATGGAVKARSDRPARAWGGRAGMKKGGKKGKSGHTTNVIIHPSAPSPLPGHPMVPGVAGGAPPPAPPPSMPPMPPKPPMGAGPAPPGPMGPMGGPPPPGVPPPTMPMRKRGGKVEAMSSEDSQTAGIGKGRTKITRFFPSNKQDTPNIGRDAVVTKATGGPISSPAKGDMGVKLPGGSGGGKAKMFKAHRLAKSGYGKQTVSASNPTRDPT